MITNKIKRVSELFTEFSAEQTTQSKSKTAKLTFTGVDGLDVYNITAPFKSGSKCIIAGRVEPRDQEHSTVYFFEEVNGQWQPVVDAPTFTLQDPFVTFINQELIFGGVEINDIGNGRLEWKTVFYRGSDIFNLVKMFTGPVGMKDIRLCGLANGHVGVFTRPQGVKGGRGTIGYTEVASLNDLSVEIINEADLLEGMFHSMDWGGVNETHLLENGEIGLLAHLAHFEQDDGEQERHYYAASFVFDPMTRKYRELKIIACRGQFTDGPAKRPGLEDVIFSSGLVYHNGSTTLYAGVSDVEAHWLKISAPF